MEMMDTFITTSALVGIVIVVASLLSGLLDRSGVPYVFIYLSDHGESLMEGGVVFHGGPPGLALPAEQAQIPLIVKSSVPISIVGRREYRQPDLYDTVLDLFSIQSAILRTWTKAALTSGPSRAFLSRFMMAARYAVGLMPAREASNFCPSSGRVPPLAMG